MYKDYKIMIQPRDYVKFSDFTNFGITFNFVRQIIHACSKYHNLRSG